jgi:hypothetical protein
VPAKPAGDLAHSKANFHQAAQAASLIKREVTVFCSHGDPGHSRCRTWFENLASAIIAQVAQSRALAELQAEQERMIQRLGLPAEQRKFTPHVTLARLRGTTVGETAEYLALRGGFTARPFPVGRFVLFSARDAVGGGPYVVEEAYPLIARAA